jgi:hypothetical protein
MRGLYTATVLDTIMRRFAPKKGVDELDVGKGFDLITGTSTGGIIACGLAFGLSTRKIIEIYRESGQEIFHNPIPTSKKKFVLWGLRNIKKAANKNKKLRAVLEDRFDNTTVEEMYVKRQVAICIPAVNMATQKPWIFKTPHDPEKQRDNKYRLVDICLATSAAPLILPLVSINEPNDNESYEVFADGGLWANNPVMIGLIEALMMAGNEQPIEILSIGTCPPPAGQSIDSTAVDWGIIDWVSDTKVLNVSLDAQSSGYDFMANFMAKYISRTGRSCKILRLPQTPPSVEQIEHLGLDKATPTAIRVLTQMAKNDGNQSHGLALSENDEKSVILKAIFEGMPELQEKL